MKTVTLKFLVLFLFLINSCNKSNSPNNVNLTQGLLAYYPFNGNANDQSGNKLNGIIQGGVVFSADKAGKPNSAVTFDGVSGYILVPDSNGLLATDAVSISFLTNLSDVANRGALINRVNFNSSAGLSYGVNMSSPTPNERFNFGAIPNNFDCSSSAYDIYNVMMDNGFVILPNQWYHVVAVFSDSVQQIYVNGILRTRITKNYKTLNKCSGSSLLIGGWWKNDIISVKGSMDEIRIYNRALNQDEITALAKPVK
jgi:hypothetical protein